MGKVMLNKPLTFAVVAASVLILTGCETYQKAMDGQKTQYRTAERRTQSLEVPPDLTSQSADEQFLIPGETQTGAVSATSLMGGRTGAQGGVAGTRVSEPVLLQSDKVEIQRVGNVRSLKVQMPPEQLWPVLRNFWQETGFQLTIDDPRIGVMETNWAENRAAIPMDGVRAVVGRFIDGLYSSNTRDRYRTRVEPIDGGVEVFITHRGMEERYTDPSETNLQWVNRAGDPELEAEMLNRLMVKLVGDEKVDPATGRDPSRQLITVDKKPTGSTLVLAEDFPLAWRRVGFGLDRAGFIVEDRDRSSGTYFVRYIPDSARVEKSETGFLGRIFGRSGKGDDKLQADQRFQVVVEAVADRTTQVRFTSEKGSALNAALSDEATTRLAGNLR